MKAVFLDRDGTINHEESNYLLDLKKLKIFDESFEAIQLLNQHGFKTIVVTNQSCVGRGLLEERDLQKINSALKKKLAERKARVDSIYYCPHHPNDQCVCRKPKLGMFEQAVKEHKISLKKSFVIGDREFDIHAGKAAGCKTILVLTGAGQQTLGSLKHSPDQPDFVASHILDAAHWIIRQTASQ
ncbi:MAG: D-glycero-beta-D-manno-heptose 1,7-bisphosphate 7-phosphatase [Deltaproteobacteria bacterium]|nr:D-glycero-beta-D-manno-heptose 1,7-bisphosphate 7-phosphatase [Deltaproteobacteria bacterium]